MKKNKTAVVLLNLGGPDRPESVKPFLFNLFNDRAIISLPQPFRFLLAKLISSKRNKTAQEIYQHIGGKSPLLEITRGQADALEKELSYLGDFRVFVCMRYWHPFASEVIDKIADFEPDQVILLPLYGQFSTATTQSSFDDFSLAWKKAIKSGKIESEVVMKKICCYFAQDDFVLSHAKLILRKIIETGFALDEFRILFSAHGLPQKLIDAGDPYVFQVEATTKAVMAKLVELLEKDGCLGKDLTGKIDFKVCYQSKVGPLKWTGPSLDQEIRRVAVDKKNPIIVPIAFVSEHSETLVELDIEYKEMAEELGVKKYVRVDALNADGHFIAGLKQMCLNVAMTDGGGIFAGCKGDCGRGCGAGGVMS